MRLKNLIAIALFALVFFDVTKCSGQYIYKLSFPSFETWQDIRDNYPKASFEAFQQVPVYVNDSVVGYEDGTAYMVSFQSDTLYPELDSYLTPSGFPHRFAGEYWVLAAIYDSITPYYIESTRKAEIRKKWKHKNLSIRVTIPLSKVLNDPYYLNLSQRLQIMKVPYDIVGQNIVAYLGFIIPDDQEVLEADQDVTIEYLP